MASNVWKTSFLTVSLSAAALWTGMISPSYAGFQWTAPTDINRAQQAGPMPSVPAPRVERAPSMPQTMPQTMPMPAPQASAPQKQEPQIMLEPMPAPSSAPQSAATSAPQPSVPNITMHDTPSMMPGASVMPQSSSAMGANQPVQRPAPSIGVENGMNPAMQDTPRRMRPQMTPQPLIPPRGAQMAQPIPDGEPFSQPRQAQIGNPYSGSVDFVPTHSATPDSAITADKILRRREQQAAPSASQNAATTGGWTSAAPQPVISEPMALSRDTGPVSPQARPAQPDFGAAPTMATSSRAPMIEVPFSSQGRSFEDAVGFGKDLPLMTAVKQIVPDDFGLSFAAGVPTDVNISWQGGRPWNEALDLALAPHGLQAVISGNVVTIAYMTPQMVPSQYEEATRMPAQKSVMMAPILDDSMVPQDSVMPNPTNILQPALMERQNANNTPSDLFVPAASTGPTTQPLIGAMTPNASAYPPAQSMNPQVYDGSVQFWAAPKDSSLREVLTSWTRKAGVELFWASEYDYPISAAVNVEGNFEEAVQTLLSGLGDSSPRPLGRLHPNLPNGPAVLVIESRGMPQ